MLQWAPVKGTATSSCTGYSTGQGETKRERRHLWGALSLQIFTGRQDLPCFYTSSHSPENWPTPSSAPAESTSSHGVIWGLSTSSHGSFLARGLAGDSTTKQAAALCSTCAQHGTLHRRVHDLHRWSGVSNRLQGSSGDTAAGPLYTSIMGQWVKISM